MPPLVNSLLEWTDPNGEQKVERILYVDQDRDTAQVIRIDRSDVLPEARRLSEIESGLASDEIRVLTADPFAYLQKPEETIPAKHRRRRDAAWAIISPIVTAPNGDAFDPKIRGRLIRISIQKNCGSKKHIYRYLRRYWQAGMTPNALLPYFHLCGAAGKDRNLGADKRGRPRRSTKLKGAPPGINIGPDQAEKLRKGYRMFYQKAPEDGGRTLKSAHLQTLRKFFHVGFESRGGVMVEALPPADQLPTFDQFLYWAKKGEDLKDSLLRRQGERKFNLRLRPVLGDSTLMAFGPGTLYQLDTTPGDDWVVSALNRARRLGRPTVVLVVDTFTHMIAGFHAGLESASFFTAGLALENAISDKVAYCRQFGIEILPEDWPNFGLPEGVLGDRGELEGHSASNLVQSLGIRVSNTSPFRADLKGIVERTFRSMNDLLIHNLPGAVRKPKERGERDPRLDAVLTMNEFRVLVIHAILQHNSRRIESYRLQKDMIADGVQPRPVDLWAWGIKNRSGHLREKDPAIVRSNLLPWDKATVTHRGIKYGHLMYGCDRAMREHWYERARASRSWRVDVAYDPRLVDTIYLRPPGAQPLERCDLLDVDQRFKGLSWPDVEDFFLSQQETREHSRTSDRQALANFHAPVEAVVKNASKAAAAANDGLTKAAQLRDVQKNRQAERRLDFAATVVALGPVPTTSKNNGEANSGGDLSEGYVPPPSHLEMLRKQRESTWRKNGN